MIKTVKIVTLEGEVVQSRSAEVPPVEIGKIKTIGMQVPPRSPPSPLVLYRSQPTTERRRRPSSKYSDTFAAQPSTHLAPTKRKLTQRREIRMSAIRALRLASARPLLRLTSAAANTPARRFLNTADAPLLYSAHAKVVGARTG